MIARELLGEIMTDRGFVTRQQVSEALQRQGALFEEKPVQERVQRAGIVSELRLAADRETTPLLGKILTEMEFATIEQVEEALKVQHKMIEVYKSLESEKLGTAIELSSIVNSTLNLAEVLALIMRHVNQVTNSVASTLMLRDDETGELVFRVPTGPMADRLTDIRIPPGKGIAGWVAEYGRPLLVPNVREDPRFYEGVDKISGFETKSILCVPLKTKTGLIGVLEVINKIDGTTFSEEDTLLLRIFAHQASMAIENARLHEELKYQLEQEKEIQTRLHQAQRLEAVGTLAGGIAHDFNNLLMGIQGNVSLMLFDVDSSHPHYERLKSIEEHINSGAKLTKQLLGFARSGKYETKPTNLNDLLKKSSEMFGRTKKEISIHLRYQKDIWTVVVDPGQIEQVLLILYVNAWQAMPGGGDLYLETKNVAIDESHVKPFAVETGNYVEISVTDTGVGMDKKTLQRIFDPFFTTKEARRGAGLGLASVYGIIENHGGIIDVYSEKGKGTTFNIYLPAVVRELTIDD